MLTSLGTKQLSYIFIETSVVFVVHLLLVLNIYLPQLTHLMPLLSYTP